MDMAAILVMSLSQRKKGVSDILAKIAFCINGCLRSRYIVWKSITGGFCLNLDISKFLKKLYRQSAPSNSAQIGCKYTYNLFALKKALITNSA